MMPLRPNMTAAAFLTASGAVKFPFLSHVKITDREKCHDVFYESDGVVKI